MQPLRLLAFDILNSITSPLVLVDDRGLKIWSNEAGARQLERLLVLAEIQGAPVDAGAQILACLRQSFASTVACEGGYFRVTPLAEHPPELPEARGLLEWFAESNADKLHILQEVSQAVNSSLIMEDIFESLGDVLRQFIPYRQAVIVILDDSQNAIKTLVRMSDDGNLEITGENNAFAGYDAIVDGIVRNPRAQMYSNEAFADSNLKQSLVFSEDTTSAMVVPLVNKGVVIGLIAMSTDDEAGFYYYQQELLTAVSAQLAVAVENAKFYWQTQSQASREFLINQLTKSIRQSLDIDIILGTAVTELGKVIGVSRCFIRYFPAEGEPKIFHYQLPGTRRMDVTDNDFEQRIFQMRKDQPYNPFVLNDTRDCPPQLAEQSLFAENQIKSLAVFPILVREQFVGTITLHQCEAFRAWVLEDIELLRAMAEHMGVALHQAQLFLELDQQKKELELALEELQQAQLYLVQSEKMAVLGQFVAGIAHEVNTPLGTMISNNATLVSVVNKLKSEDGPPRPALIESMNDLLSLNKLASTRIMDIVKNLRNFARLDESELKTVNVHEGIDSTLLLVQSSFQPGVKVVKAYGENLPPVHCYPGLLNQVFMNLIVNAGHAMLEREGKPSVITIATRYDASEDTVVIAIQDTGKGIPPENLAKVFDPGFTTKGVGVGTGLGLALCYRIVEKHHGRIRVESVVDEGTTFFVEIPVRPKAARTA